MGTTATKLTYLSGTKDKLKTAINYTGANITNDTFRSYADKLKLGYIDILNNGTDTLYSNIPKVSGKGSNLSLTPTYEAPMRNIPYGDTLQNGTPTPSSPIPINNVTGLQKVNVCGKNLCNLNFDEETTFIRKMISSELTLNGSTGGAGNIYNNNTNTFTLKSGTYTISSRILDGEYTPNGKDTAMYLRKKSNSNELFTIYSSINYEKTSTITLSEDTEVYMQIYTNGSGMVFDNLKIGFQIEKGSQATEYEEYKGKSYEVNLGKNLLDVSQCINGYINSNGDWSGGDNNLLTSFIPVVPGSDYTISLNTQFSNIGYALYNASKTYISRENNSNKQTLTISIPNDTFYIKVWFNYSGYTTMTPKYILQYEPMIEKGSTASTYSPYFKPIELNHIPNTDYEDYIKKSTGKNLFDKDNANVLNNLYIDENERMVKAASNVKSIYMKIVGGKTYTVSKTASSRFRVATTKVLPADNVSVYNFVKNDSETNITITANNDSQYMVIFLYNSTVDTLTLEQILATIQIEEGSTATDPEPYGVGKWYVCKKTGKLTINGTENYTFEVTPNFSNTGKTRFTIYNIPTDYNSNISQIPAMFNIALNSPDVAYSAYNNVILMRYVATQQTRLDMMSNGLSITTANDFKTWLGNNNLIDYYKINTPTYTEITNTDLINQLEALYTAKSKSGITNIFSTSENLPMILSASALKVE